MKKEHKRGFHMLVDRFFEPRPPSHVHVGLASGLVFLFIFGHLHPSHFVDLLFPTLSGLLRLRWMQPLSCTGGLSSVTASGFRLFRPIHLQSVQPSPAARCFGLYFSAPVHCSYIIFFQPCFPAWFCQSQVRSQVKHLFCPFASPSHSKSCPPGFCSF